MGGGYAHNAWRRTSLLHVAVVFHFFNRNVIFWPLHSIIDAVPVFTFIRPLSLHGPVFLKFMYAIYVT